jgi:WD40 repeat protein
MANASSILLPFVLFTAAAAEDQPALIREFKDTALIELSHDGHLILTSRLRAVKCEDGKKGCYKEVLTVYDNASGKSLGELISQNPSSYGTPDLFWKPEFVDQGEVRTIQSTWDKQRKSLVYAALKWNPISGAEQRSPIDIPKDFLYQCPLDDGRLLGLGASEIRPPYVPTDRTDQSFNMGDPANQAPRHTIRPFETMAGSSVEKIAVLTDAPFPLNLNCKASHSGRFYLIEDAQSGENQENSPFGKSLAWFSPESIAPPRPCRTFENQRIHGYAISPDSSRVAVITSLLTDPDWRTFLTVLDGATCDEVYRFELKFPEKPRPRAPLLAPSRKYLDNVPFAGQFARSITISPDNTLLAVAYGISKGISGSAFFGLYSLSDGHRMATLKGDTFTPNLQQIFISDIYSAREAPLDGALQFSPDSKSLYTSSRNLRVWDVSKVR